MIFSDIVNGVANNNNPNSGLSSTHKNDSNSAATLDINDFLKLLVAQMQYQDPMQPKDNTESIAQMAVFTQVEATNQMNNRVEQQMASSLVGKAVIMATNNNATGMVAGKVEYWEVIDGKVYLGIGGKLYDIKDLDTVMDDKFFDQITKPSEDDKVDGNGDKVDGKDDKTENSDTDIKDEVSQDE